jgi:hypothetical protein
MYAEQQGITLLQEKNGLFRWQWGDIASAPYAELEDRPWTPQIINNGLCFVASNAKQRCVVWGDHEGEWFDDVHGLMEDKNVPIYIARNALTYFVVRGQERSQPFEFQISFEVEDGGTAVYRFDTRYGIKPNDTPLARLSWK